MSRPRVLSVGQCGYDHGRIERHFEHSYGAQVRAASSYDEALDALRSEPYDLVLVNRISDVDGAPGLELIRLVKASAELAGVPLMLVSDLAEAQKEAVALGALPGFGKSELASNTTRQRLSAVLGAAGSSRQ